MKQTNIIFLLVILLVPISCKKEPVTSNNENETGIIKPELLTTKERKCIKVVIINNSGQEADLTTMWNDCTFETTYKYNEDSTYIVKDGCSDTELEYNWVFSDNKSKIFTFNDTDTTKYLILTLTEPQLKLELLNDDTEFQTVYTYE